MEPPQEKRFTLLQASLVHRVQAATGEHRRSAKENRHGHAGHGEFGTTIDTQNRGPGGDGESGRTTAVGRERVADRAWRGVVVAEEVIGVAAAGGCVGG